MPLELAPEQKYDFAGSDLRGAYVFADLRTELMQKSVSKLLDRLGVEMILDGKADKDTDITISDKPKYKAAHGRVIKLTRRYSKKKPANVSELVLPVRLTLLRNALLEQPNTVAKPVSKEFVALSEAKVLLVEDNVVNQIFPACEPQPFG